MPKSGPITFWSIFEMPNVASQMSVGVSVYVWPNEMTCWFVSPTRPASNGRKYPSSTLASIREYLPQSWFWALRFQLNFVSKLWRSATGKRATS